METTTEKAVTSGRKVKSMKDLADQKVYGAKKRYEDTSKEEAFKDVSVFNEIFTVDWDLFDRIAADPAHEFHNLVVDMLSVLCNKGSMSLKKTHLAAEHKMKRFKDITTISKAPWIASNDQISGIEEVINGPGTEHSVLRVPYGWPTMVNYFGEEIKKGKGMTVRLY